MTYTVILSYEADEKTIFTCKALDLPIERIVFQIEAKSMEEAMDKAINSQEYTTADIANKILKPQITIIDEMGNVEIPYKGTTEFYYSKQKT